MGDSTIDTKHRINNDVPIILDNRDDPDIISTSDSTFLTWTYMMGYGAAISKEKQDTRRPLILNTKVLLGIEIIPGYNIVSLASGNPVHGPHYTTEFGGKIILKLYGLDGTSKSSIVEYVVTKRLVYWENGGYEVCKIEDGGFVKQEKRFYVLKGGDEIETEYTGFYDGAYKDVEIYHYIKNGGVYYSFGEDINGFIRAYYNDDGYNTAEIDLEVKVFGTNSLPRQTVRTGAYARVEYFEEFADYLIDGPIPEEEKKNRYNFFLFWNDRDFLKIR